MITLQDNLITANVGQAHVSIAISKKSDVFAWSHVFWTILRLAGFSDASILNILIRGASESADAYYMQNTYEWADQEEEGPAPLRGSDGK